ncbi:MAG: glycoside hydrolase family 127 protein [Fimbriimonas sp.]
MLATALAVAALAPQGSPAAKVSDRLADKAVLATPSEVWMSGFLGDRVFKNAYVRLRAVDQGELLAGYQKRPGSHPWIGEHVGKYLHAISLAYAQSGDKRFRSRAITTAKALMETQEPDGYLGTYLPADRWQLRPGVDWDVWAHKYNLIGLLTYYQVFNDAQALDASRRMGDLLIATFGPDRKSILSAGTHMGMASTSVLEPMVLLYRLTGETRYLEFARYLVRSWEEPGGPDILRGLLAGKPVHGIANAKAYEMLSNLVGLCELARVTGDQRYVRAATLAWDDVRRHQRYITGTASHFEHFHPEAALPNGEADNVGETCVTVTWLQLNAQLLRLTGDAKYGAEVERAAFNHLAAAQRPDGAAWCYYTPLEGRKPYGTSTNCCLSSGPRGMAMLPTLAYLRVAPRTVAVNLLESSIYRTTVDGQTVMLTQTYRWDRPNEATLRLDAKRGFRMGLQIRVPEWAEGMRTAGSVRKDGWLRIAERQWRPGTTVRIALDVKPRRVPGGAQAPGHRAMTWGPFVYAYDEGQNPEAPFANVLSLPVRNATWVVGGSEKKPPTIQVHLDAADGSQPKATLVPFAEAGAKGDFMQVWLADGVRFLEPELRTARSGRSRMGNVRGSIVDADPRTYVVTYDGGKPAEDWYGITWRNPISFLRVTFRHGKTFHDGGWFDASQGKPRVQIRRTPGAPWEEIGTLADYPATTATSPAGLRDGQAFELVLPSPVSAVEMRVVGAPASGDNPAQAFSSCAELTIAGS